MDRAVLEVRVHPRARLDAVEVVGRDSLKVRVTAPPDRGRANEALIAILAKRLRLPRSGVRIVRGHKSRNKLLQIEGIGLLEVLKRLSS